MKYMIFVTILLLSITWYILTEIQNSATETFKTELLKERTKGNSNE
jgi:hypothetical protein